MARPEASPQFFETGKELETKNECQNGQNVGPGWLLLFEDERVFQPRQTKQSNELLPAQGDNHQQAHQKKHLQEAMDVLLDAE